jgi:hypothetical protein
MLNTTSTRKFCAHLLVIHIHCKKFAFGMAETKTVMVVMGGVFSDNGAFGSGPHPVPFGWIAKGDDFTGLRDDFVLCQCAVLMA